MTKTTKNKALLLLISACVIFLLMAFSSFSLVARADQAENDALDSAIQSADIEILDGAQASTLSPYVMAWQISIPVADREAIAEALTQAHKTKADDYFSLQVSAKSIQYRLLLFDESKIPAISAGLNGVKMTHDDYGVNFTQGMGTNLVELYSIMTSGKVPLRQPGIIVDDETFYPEYDIEITEDFKVNGKDDLYRVSIYTGADNTQTNYVPILVVYGGYFTSGAAWIGSYAHVVNRLIYNPNAVRSLNYVSTSALEDEDFMAEADDEDIAILNENVTATQVPDNLEASETITNLENTYPLEFVINSGAEYDALTGGISWTASFNIANFNQWKKQAGKISLWWIVLEFDNLSDTGNKALDFENNQKAAVRTYAEYGYAENGDKYVSTLTFSPAPGKENVYYIAIPFIKITGVKASATAGTSVGFDGAVSGSYVFCNANDNARSVNSLIGDTGEYTYTFTYAEALDGKPFAIEKTKTITRTERIDFNNMDMGDFASIIDVKLDDNGNICCLLSKVNYWLIDQTTINTYNVYAMYSIIPLTFTNDKREVEVQYLGLIPFSNIDNRSEYATLLTSLKDKDGKPYFATEYDVEKTKLYGYFYTYSYESEKADPNWVISQDSYNGYISYFTHLENVQYKMGYMEIGGYGALGGAMLGAVVGTLIAPGVGTIVGAVVGGVAGFGLAGGTAALFGAEQDSKNIYYNIEYGFLDCTTMTPGGFYDTEKEPELQIYEKIALIVVAVFELMILAWFLGKFKSLVPIGCFILAVILIGLFIWGDIWLYQFFLTGV